MSCKQLSLAALGCAIGLALAPQVGHAGTLVAAEKPIQGKYIVVLKENAALLGKGDGSIGKRVGALPTIAQVSATLAGRYNLKVERNYSEVLRGFVVQANPASIRRLLRDDRVAYIEQDGVMQASAVQNNATWGIDRIDQRSLPLDGSYRYDSTTSNVSAYIIDTGIRASHSQFGGRVHAGFTAINDGYGSSDCAGHGTHVAGTVGGATYGVAKGVQLYPVRVLGCSGSGSTSGIIAGMDWVARTHNGPSVANMSLGGGASTATDQAVARLRNSGVTVVVAAGNENQDACNVSPARAAGAITVGSTTSNDYRSSFSNWGRCVNIFAPGSGITSAWNSSDSATNRISGTSMATPHVVGAVALYLSTHPQATPAEVEAALYENASQNKVGNAAGSANRLLYAQFAGGENPDPGDGDGDNGGTTVTGYLSGTGYFADHPDPYQQVVTGGTIRASLQGPANADFELHLYRWNGRGWEIVARSESPTSNESIQYNASPGYYTVEVYSYRGYGNYRLEYALPR